MLKTIDALLDKLTMYRLLLYYLIALLLAAMGLSAFGHLSYNPLVIAGCALYLVAACLAANRVFAWVFDVPVSYESSLITALILALIITPSTTEDGILFFTAAAGLAMASKYTLTIRKQHIFNPAAIAVVLTALGPHQTASWWVGNSAMMPFVLIGGILLIRRIRHTAMVVSFFASAIGATIFYTILSHGNVLSGLHKTIFSSALLFMGFVMLTEPLTSPSTKKHRLWYGVLAGLFFPPRVHIGNIFSTPELVLSVGNVFSYLVNPRVKLFPALVRKERITPDTIDFVFASNRQFSFLPGQYMEWTLSHRHTDSRGSRRYFTLASSPTEPNVRIGVKFYPKGSSFKHAMLTMDSRTPIVAANLGGDFVLPPDCTRKIVLIAGGIGVTPYRSMLKCLLDKDERRPITLLYSARTAEDIAYFDVFEQAREHLGINIIYVLTKPDAALPDERYRTGRITPELVQAEVPDHHERLFYISGPDAMVTSTASMLRDIGVSHEHIKTDSFSGYA
jgi:ferredoxin-NADP reductase/Na+-translocating ferredoxin:NAD+ oxidoreductase RnfD subunit